MTVEWSPWFDGQSGQSIQLQQFKLGRLEFAFANGEVLYAKLDGVEFARRIYAAVRDPQWGTVVPVINSIAVERDELVVSIRFDVSNYCDPIGFEWKGHIQANAQGQFSFAFSGKALRSFDANRIGLCLLHPVDTTAGKSVLLTDGDGRESTIQFPIRIEPRNFAFNVAKMRYQATPMTEIAIEFSGELFETEDQRNWIDDSFKTFCRPQTKPWPFHVVEGEQIEQRIEIQANQTSDSCLGFQPDDNKKPTVSKHRLRLIRDTAYKQPELGVCWVAPAGGPSDWDFDRLRALNLDHIRVDIDLTQSDQRPVADRLNELSNAFMVCDRLSCKIELATFLDNQSLNQLEEIHTSVVQNRERIARILVFSSDAWNTSQYLQIHATPVLKSWLGSVPIVVGTQANFTELNRTRPSKLEGINGVCFSTHPQEHAFDNLSLIETAKVVGQAIESTRPFAPNGSICVGPITLRKRVNPYGAPVIDDVPSGLPPRVDRRQMSLLGCGWTLAVVKYLAEGGVAAATLYEALGWKGLFESSLQSNMDGRPTDARFLSQPGQLFPIYHLLEHLGRCKGGRVIECESSDRLQVECYAIRCIDRTEVVIANLSDARQTVELEGYVQKHSTPVHPQMSVAKRSINASAGVKPLGAPPEPVANNINPSDLANLQLQPFEIVFLTFA
jgi:D-apionolactonase